MSEKARKAYDVNVTLYDIDGNPTGDDWAQIDAASADEAAAAYEADWLSAAQADADDADEAYAEITGQAVAVDDSDDTASICAAHSTDTEKANEIHWFLAAVGDYSTDMVGVLESPIGPPSFFARTENGGKIGTHDRTCGDGQWRDRDVSPPVEIETVGDAVRAIEALGRGRREAIDAIVAAQRYYDAAAIIADRQSA